MFCFALCVFLMAIYPSTVRCCCCCHLMLLSLWTLHRHMQQSGQEAWSCPTRQSRPQQSCSTLLLSHQLCATLLLLLLVFVFVLCGWCFVHTYVRVYICIYLCPCTYICSHLYNNTHRHLIAPLLVVNIPHGILKGCVCISIRSFVFVPYRFWDNPLNQPRCFTLSISNRPIPSLTSCSSV